MSEQHYLFEIQARGSFHWDARRLSLHMYVRKSIVRPNRVKQMRFRGPVFLLCWSRSDHGAKG